MKVQDVFNTHFTYDKSSPTFLRWKVDKGNRKAGTIAGCASQYNTKGERCCGVLGFNDKRYLLSRVIWAMFNGPIPDGLIIDHRDGDPWNNSIDNLKCKERRHNNQNRKTKENTIGVPGVNFTKKGVYEYITASVYINGKPVYKHFSILKLGVENAKLLAIEWRIGMIKKLVEAGEMYTDRHLGTHVSESIGYEEKSYENQNH